MKSLLCAALAGLLLTACHQNRYEAPAPGASTGTKETYPLSTAYAEGFSGQLTLVKQADGSAVARLALTGMRAGKHYYAQLARGSASVLTSTPVFADLKEVSASGSSETWLQEDYLNQPLLFDSLLTMNAMVKVLEVTPGQAGAAEVLRGDIGSNQLLPEVRTYALVPYEGSGVTGTVSLQVRRNGNYLATTTLQGLARNAFAPVRLWSGRPEQVESARTLVKLNPVDGVRGFSISEVPGLKGGLAALDTLNGYFGVGASQGFPDMLVAVGPLRR